MIKQLHITSAIRPEGGGTLACRISLHRSEGHLPIATHVDVLKDGRWTRSSGNYFAEGELLDAVQDYKRRCRQLGVADHEED